MKTLMAMKVAGCCSNPTTTMIPSSLSTALWESSSSLLYTNSFSAGKNNVLLPKPIPLTYSSSSWVIHIPKFFPSPTRQTFQTIFDTHPPNYHPLFLFGKEVMENRYSQLYIPQQQQQGVPISSSSISSLSPLPQSATNIIQRRTNSVDTDDDDDDDDDDIGDCDDIGLVSPCCTSTGDDDDSIVVNNNRDLTKNTSSSSSKDGNDVTPTNNIPVTKLITNPYLKVSSSSLHNKTKKTDSMRPSENNSNMGNNNNDNNNDDNDNIVTYKYSGSTRSCIRCDPTKEEEQFITDLCYVTDELVTKLMKMGIVDSKSKSNNNNGGRSHYYNCCLVNWYRPNHTIGLHSDDEKELDLSMPIVSLSWGGPRRFLLRPKPHIKSITKSNLFEFQLSDGDLFIMGGQCQQEFKHEVPKVRMKDGLVTDRICWTVRCLKQQQQQQPRRKQTQERKAPTKPIVDVEDKGGGKRQRLN